jgi:hypothetical protein
MTSSERGEEAAVSARESVYRDDANDRDDETFSRSGRMGRPETLGERQWPDALGEAAFQGLAGEIVRVIEPRTEADPVAVLASLLGAVGNAIGPTPLVRIGREKHRCNLNLVLVGRTAGARKGTSWSEARAVVGATDSVWLERVTGGLVSGEGLIWHVRDPRTQVAEDGAEKVLDEGASDKRLLAFEAEFASVLSAASRDGSTLSPTLRNAWDGLPLRTLAKNAPAVATGAHVSVLAHITAEELRRGLSATEKASGFANRFIWLCVQRSRSLPHGAAIPDDELAPLVSRLRDAVMRARRVGSVERDRFARRRWEEVYDQLTEERPGLTGAILARAAPQATRLSLVYALLDGAEKIRTEHVDAGLALWRYAEQSVIYIWGDSLGDPMADTLDQALRRAKKAGLTRTQIRDLFGRNAPASTIEPALGLLLRYGRAVVTSEETGGRPAERWYAVVYAPEENPKNDDAAEAAGKEDDHEHRPEA